MKTSFPRVVVALLAFVFVLAACAGETGTQWTFAPTTAEQPAVPVEPGATPDVAEPEATSGAEATSEPAVPGEPVATAAPVSGEPRVIELQADSALRFTDPSGQPVNEIAVTPGETILFRVDNTAGFTHNLFIGQESELSAPSATTDVGIPDWETGVQELEWVVPEDISGLMFACTVPGHFFTMQGSFVLAEAGAEVEPAGAAEATGASEAVEPEATQAHAMTVATAVPEASAAVDPSETQPAAADGEARVVEFEADAAIRFMQGGDQLREIEVTPGETVVFRIDNTAGFAHNFYIGPDSDLQVMGGTTDTGIPDWNTGVQELEWVVPEDVSDLRFACTVPGHYFTMQGDFVVSP